MPPTLHPMFVRWLEPALTAAEGAGAAPVALPANAESGASLGPMQLDLSRQIELRGALARLGRRSLVPGDLDDLFAKPVRRMTPSERARAADLLARLLALPEGAVWLARCERAALVRVGLAVRRLIAGAAPGAAGFAASLRGQVELGCHLHQFGTGSTGRLAKFLAGERVAFDGSDGTTRAVAFREPLDVAQFREFRRATRWGATYPRACESRHARVDHAMRAAPADA